MRLYIIVVFEEATQTKMVFLLYEKSREQAKKHIRRHCEEQGWRMGWMASHDVTLDEESIQRIDNLM